MTSIKRVLTGCLLIGSSVLFAAHPAKAIVYLISGTGTYPSDGPGNNSAFTETFSFSGSFDYNGNTGSSVPLSLTSITGSTLVRPISFTFNAGTYNSGSAILTFTGSQVPNFGPTQLIVTLLNPLTSATISQPVGFSAANLRTICSEYQDNGNNNCRTAGNANLNNLAGGAREVPGALSVLVLAPLVAAARYRKRFLAG